MTDQEQDRPSYDPALLGSGSRVPPPGSPPRPGAPPGFYPEDPAAVKPESRLPRLWQTLTVIAVLVLCAVGVARIVDTYSVFNHTFDEPAHIAGGLEYLEGKYTLDLVHPPLARALVALGPFLDGARHSDADGNPLPESAALYDGDRYDRRLRLARIAVLPFFLIAVAVVWSWTRSAFGVSAAVGAVALFTTLPPVLAHAGLATTDMIFTAIFGAAVLAFANWLREPYIGNAFALALLLGLSCLIKLSTLLFFPAAVVCILIAHLFLGSERAPEDAPSHAGGVIFGGLVVLVMIWAGYQFSLGPLVLPENRPHVFLDKVAADDEAFKETLYTITEAPYFPAPEFARGINATRIKNEKGHAVFIQGKRLENHGVWTFFPVALGVKTPLAFLLLVGTGAVLVIRLAGRTGSWYQLAPLLAALGVLLIALPSNINLGVRHVLPVYLLLCPIAGLALSFLFRARIVGIVIGAATLLWHFSAGALIHPDYLGYFNELAGDDPASILVDSDLDWGQDLHRLARELEAKGIQDVALAYFGSANPDSAGIRYRELPPYSPETGWIAISRTRLKMEPGYEWLEVREPEYLVGRSIEVYHISAPDSVGEEAAAGRR